MSQIVERLLSDDFVWSALSNAISGKRKRSATGFINFDCPMCTSRGETPDRKQRCGIKNSAGTVGVHCHNCGFRTLWRPGELLSRNMRDFLEAVGVPASEVKRLNLTAMSYRSVLEKSPEALASIPGAFAPSFNSMDLPAGSRPIEAWAAEASPPADFIDAVAYLYGRGEEIAAASTYYWTPETKNGLNRRIIIPFNHEGRIVGYTARAIDPGTTRYHMESPQNFLFNARALSLPRRKYVVLCEGVFDALAVDGVGLLGARLNPQQIAWIKSFGKQVILVADRDQRGSAMIDVAMANNWSVAFPRSHKLGSGIQAWWDTDVKDCADAVKRYGRLWTLLSIIETATSSKFQIGVYRKLLG